MKNRSIEEKIGSLEQLWSPELPERCCISVQAPLNPRNPYHGEVPKNPADLYRWYNDGEWILQRTLAHIEGTYYAGEALPMLFPYFGTGGHAKYIAPESAVEYAPDTVWIHPVIADLESYDYSFDPETNPVFQRELSILQYLSQESRGRFLVGSPDNCGSYDALAQLRGNEELLMDFLDEPEAVRKAGLQLIKILQQTGDLFFQAASLSCFGGSVQGWMNTFCQGRHLQLQCDLSVMLSKETFGQFITEELRLTSQWLDKAIYHLDGIEQIRHLPEILSVPGINMIQWTQVAGQPPAIQCLEALQKIQESGRGLTIVVDKDQVRALVENLSPRGLNLVTNAASPEEADDIVAFVENFYK